MSNEPYDNRDSGDGFTGFELSLDELQELSRTVWETVRRHPLSATCECPGMEAADKLFEIINREDRP